MTARVLGGGQGLTHQVIYEVVPCLLVDQAGDTLDAATASQTTDRLGDALDVVAEHFAMTLDAALA